MIDEALKYVPLFIAILQLAFVILFACFYRSMMLLKSSMGTIKDDIEAIMSFLVITDGKANSIIKRQNVLGQLIMRSAQRLGDHDAYAHQFIDKLGKQWETEIDLLRKAQAESEYILKQSRHKDA